MSWGEETKTTRTPKAPPVSCAAGERYAHIKIGGLLFKKTAFKGCGTPKEIAYWERQKQADERRWQNFAQGLANGANLRRFDAELCTYLHHLKHPSQRLRWCIGNGIPLNPVTKTTLVEQRKVLLAAVKVLTNNGKHP